MRLFLGVDGGQSGTLALVGDDAGRVIGVGRAGPVNHAGAAEGRVRFVAAVLETVRAALEQAGVVGGAFESACFGFSGGPADKAALTRELVKAHRYVITHDASIALAGAVAREPGIITIAGTGSIAFGRNAEQRTARAGGWGYAFGDEGGGFDLVRQALRAVLRHEEGWGPPTLLRTLLLEAAKDANANASANANDLMHRFYTDEYPRARVAAMAPLIDQAAGAGDAIAQEILKGAAQSLATLAGAVRAQLFGAGETVTVSYAGGVFRSPIILERFRMLLELEDRNRVAAPRYGPAAGALLEAYGAAGVPVTLKDVPQEKL